MRNTKRRSDSGFTLIESMIATVVLAACAVGVCGALVASAQSTEDIESRTACVDAARLNLEALAASRLANLSSATGSATTEQIDSTNIDDRIPRTETAGQIRYVQRTGAQNARDIAVVSVTVRSDTGQTVTLYRVLTRAEVHR